MGEPNKVYVGNIPYNMLQEDLQDKFEVYGDIDEVIIIKDRESGKSKGFGFVTFCNTKDADRAIAGLNGKEMDGRDLTVSHAQPPRSSGGGGGGGGRYGGGGGGGRYGGGQSYHRSGGGDYNSSYKSGGRRDNYDRDGRDNYSQSHSRYKDNY